MAKEMQLIDANELKAELQNELYMTDSTKAAFRSIIRKVPTVDAVEVVRCKDCEYYNECSERCKFWHGVRHPEHYCGEGERSDGDEETCP